MRNRNKALTKDQIYRRMELTNKTCGCLAAFGSLALRFVVFAAFAYFLILFVRCQ